MKALSFLGAGRYEEVTYVWSEGREGERSYTTRLFPEALAQIFQPEKVIVFVTEKAKNYCPSPSEPRYVETLQERLGDRVEWVDIPEGRSEQELWEIFDKVASAVNDGDTVLLDITHAFRSIPMIVFAVAAYLRRTKGVTIERIVYGAYEARQTLRTSPQPEDRAPIFDLTPLLDLLDWLSGAETLQNQGDARTLASRLEQTQRSLWRRQGGDTLPRRLQNIARQLRNLSQALHLARPIDVMKTAHTLCPMLKKAHDEFHQWAKPFAVIVEKVFQEMEALAYEQPERLDVENLRRQLTIVEYCLWKNLTMQAITLAREWLVSLVALQRKEGDWLALAQREEAEKALGAAVRKWHRQESVDVPGWFEQWTLSQKAAEVWDWLTQLRNDVAHCGMNPRAASPNSILERARQIPGRLRALLDEAPAGVLWTGRVVIDLKSLYTDTAKLDELPRYIERAKELAGEGNEVVLTGQAPIWMYLAIAHALHGKARRLLYHSPITGEVLIFGHGAK